MFHLYTLFKSIPKNDRQLDQGLVPVVDGLIPFGSDGLLYERFALLAEEDQDRH